MSHITGRYHYRQQRRLFGAPLLVLQFEEFGSISYMDNGKRITYEGYSWRDATPDDLKNVPDDLQWVCVLEKPVDTGKPPRYNEALTRYPPF